MSPRMLALIVVVVLFGALSAVALLEVGLTGIFAVAFSSWGGAQVFVDLAILAALACIWLVADARARGANPWPYVAATVLTGSFGVLFYLVSRELSRSPSLPASARARSA